MKLNQEQSKLIELIRVGVIPIPESGVELADLIVKVLSVFDDDNKIDNQPVIGRCKERFIDLVVKKSKNNSGWVYASSISDSMKRIGYFSKLSNRISKEGKDALKLITRSLIDDGLIEVVGIKIIPTQKAFNLTDAKSNELI